MQYAYNTFTVYTVCLAVTLVWWFGEIHRYVATAKSYKQCHAIYTVNMGFFPYSTPNSSIKILPISFYEQITKSLTHQQFHIRIQYVFKLT